jgi:hypothetical protein
MLEHLNSRLNHRELNHITPEKCLILANQCDKDTAIVLGKIKFLDDLNYVILIVRGKYPCTIFYRRVTQTISIKSLGVQEIKYIQ